MDAVEFSESTVANLGNRSREDNLSQALTAKECTFWYLIVGSGEVSVNEERITARHNVCVFQVNGLKSAVRCLAIFVATGNATQELDVGRVDASFTVSD